MSCQHCEEVDRLHAEESTLHHEQSKIDHRLHHEEFLAAETRSFLKDEIERIDHARDALLARAQEELERCECEPDLLDEQNSNYYRDIDRGLRR